LQGVGGRRVDLASCVRIEVGESAPRCRSEEMDMKVVVSEFTSLDGVVQAPGGTDEDTSGGFRHGGWWMPYFDPEVMGPVIDGFADRCEVLLQGRRTY